MNIRGPEDCRRSSEVQPADHTAQMNLSVRSHCSIFFYWSLSWDSSAPIARVFPALCAKR